MSPHKNVRDKVAGASGERLIVAAGTGVGVGSGHAMKHSGHSLAGCRFGIAGSFRAAGTVQDVESRAKQLFAKLQESRKQLLIMHDLVVIGGGGRSRRVPYHRVLRRGTWKV